SEARKAGVVPGGRRLTCEPYPPPPRPTRAEPASSSAWSLASRSQHQTHVRQPCDAQVPRRPPSAAYASPGVIPHSPAGDHTCLRPAPRCRPAEPAASGRLQVVDDLDHFLAGHPRAVADAGLLEARQYRRVAAVDVVEG